MPSKTKTSMRQRIVCLSPGEWAEFPIEKYGYLTTLAYQLGRTFRRKYSCRIGGDVVRVTRIS